MGVVSKVSFVAALALPLAACSGSGPGGSSSTTSTSAGTAHYSAMDASVSGPAPALPGAKKGGTLTITYTGAPPTFDPSGAYYEMSMTVLSDLELRSLTGYQIRDGHATLVPDLATDLGQQSADGLTWTFHLKKGMKYSDGSTITAADFVYATKRSFAYESVAANGPQYLPYYLVGGSSYKGPFVQPKANFQGVDAPDASTVVFHLAHKWPTLPYYMAFPEASPIPQSKDTKGSYQSNPLAEGPYMTEKFVAGQSITLVRNPRWDADSDPVRHQYPDRIVVQLGVNALTMQQRILTSTGSGTTTIDVSGVDASLASQVTGSKKSQFLSGPSPCESYLPLNTQTIPLAVRKAIAVAYPYDQIHKAMGDSTLSYQPATTYGPPQVPGITQYPPVNDLTGKGTGDPAKAKQMLQAAHETGFALSYYFTNDKPQSVAANVALKQALTSAGFKVKDVPVSTDQAAEKTSDPNASENVGQGISSWCYDWPSGDSIYPQLFLSSNAKLGRSIGNMRSAAIDAQINRISAMAPDQAAVAWGKFDQQMATAYLPGLPLSYWRSSYVFGTKVHGVTNDPNHGLPDFAQLWVG